MILAAPHRQSPEPDPRGSDRRTPSRQIAIEFSRENHFGAALSATSNAAFSTRRSIAGSKTASLP